MAPNKPITKDVVLATVRNRGPSIPLDLYRVLGGDTILMGAFLSELSQSNVLKVSSVKIGGSPLYYFEEQRDQLQNFSRYLNEKDRRSYELLKEKKVLRDSDQTPLVQISLRNIKDFSIPLLVKIDGKEEQFFKWYLLSNEEASEYIKIILSGNKFPIQSQQSSEKSEPEKEKKEQLEKHLEHNVKSERNSILDDYSNRSSENLSDKQDASELKKISERPQTIPNPVSSVKKTVSREVSSDAFFVEISPYFGENGIEVIKTTIDKKGKELSLELDVPSPFGHVRFFCKALKKAKINDSDLSKAYVQSQSSKLPVIFLYSGELSKKALDFHRDFINFIVKKIE